MKTANFSRINLRVFEGIRNKTLRNATCKESISNLNERVIRPIALGQVPVAQELKLEALKLMTEINRKLFELPAKAERQVAQSASSTQGSAEEILTYSDKSLAEALVDEQDLDAHPPEYEEIEVEAETERFTPPSATGDNAKTQVFTPGGSGARTVVRDLTPDDIEAQAQTAPEPEKPKILFTSVTKILELTPEEEKVVQDAELTEGAFKSILRKLTDTAEVQSARVAELENEVARLKAEKEKLTGEILDELAEKFPSLAKKAKALKRLLS